MKKHQISSAVVRRLPKYYRHLDDLEKAGLEKVSSQQLSEKTGFTASQIRQDLNHFGGFGQQGYGYKVTSLKEAIAKIIGLDKSYNAIIVGYGHIGQAIKNYKGFYHHDFNIKAVFDVEAKNVDGVEVKPISEIKDYLRENETDVLILTVPKEVAQDIAENLEEGSVKAIWNFAPIDVKSKHRIPVENVHLSESLYSLIFYLWNVDEYKF